MKTTNIFKNKLLLILYLVFSLFYIFLIDTFLKKPLLYFTNFSETYLIQQNKYYRNYIIKNEIGKIDQLNLLFNKSMNNSIDFELQNIKSSEYTFYVDSTSTEYNLLKIFFNKPYLNDNIQFTINDENSFLLTNTSGDILSKQYKSNKILSFLVIFLFCILLIIFLIIFILVNLKINSIEIKYLLFSFLLGIAFLFVRVPCSQYDDLLHFDSVYNMSNIIMGYGDALQTGTLKKRSCDLNLLPDYYPNNFEKQSHGWHDTYIKYYKHAAKNFSFHPELQLVDSNPSKVIKPQRAYLFSALAITFARLLHLNQFLLYYSGCFLNLIISLLVIYSGIKILPAYKDIFVIIGLFPVVLLELSSYSYDSVLIAISFYILCFCLNYASNTNQKLISPKNIFFIFVCLFIIPIKVVYFPLVFILPLFLITKYKKLSNKTIILSFIFIIVLFYFSIIIFSSLKIIPYLNNNNINDISKLPCYSIKDIFLHPFYSLKVIFNSFMTPFYWMKIEGLFVYNPIEEGVYLPKLYFLIYFILFSLLFSVEKDSFIDSRILYIISLISLVIILFIILAFFTFTDISSDSIWGLQIRYFIPVLPSIIIFFRKKITSNKLFFITPETNLNICIIVSFFYCIDMFLSIICGRI